MNTKFLKWFNQLTRQFNCNYFQTGSVALCLILQIISTLNAYSLGKPVSPLHSSLDASRRQNKEIPELKQGQPVERKITGAESQFYNVKLTANQAIIITVEQHGVDLALTLRAPDRSVRGDADSPNGAYGNEEILIIADKGGDYQLEIKPFEADLSRGSYRASIKTLRPATAADRKNYEAYQIISQANETRSKGDAASMRDSLEKYNEALEIFRVAKDVRGQAQALYKLGETNQNLTNLKEALVYYNRSLPFWDSLGDKSAEVVIQSNIGLAFDDIGESQKAKASLERALAYSQSIGDKIAEAGTFNLLGRLFFKQSQYPKATDYFNRALAIFHSFKNSEEANVLANLGAVYSEIGEYQKAIDFLTKALPLLKKIGDQNGEGFANMTSGDINFLLGDYPKAVNSYTQALTIFQTTGERGGQAQALNNIGKVYWLQGDINKSREFLEKALAVSIESEDHLREAYILNNLGLINLKEGDKVNALKYSEKALPLVRSLNNLHGEAQTYDTIGTILLASGEPQKAIENFTTALSLNRNAEEKAEEANTLGNLMVGWKTLNNPRLAILYGKQAISIYQAIRFEIKSLTRELQKSFLQEKESTYRILANILIEQGRITEAEQVLKMLKDEEFSEYLKRDENTAKNTAQKVTLTPDETAAIKRYKELAEKITAIGREYGQLNEESKKYQDMDKPFPEQIRLATLEKQLDDANVAFKKFLEELKITFGNEDKRVADVASGLQLTLIQMNAKHTAIVSTIVGNDQLDIIVTTADTQTAHSVDIKNADVNRLVADFRAAVTNPNVDPRPLGNKLYDILVKPIEKDLAGIDADTIVWSLDGTLRYAPVAALWDGENYLVQRYANVIITLAGRTNLVQEISNKSNWRALGAGTSKVYENFPALIAVPDELDCIITDSVNQTVSANPKCKNGVISGKKILDDKFTKDAFKNAMGRYALVHIASHFSLQPGDDKNSFLLLGGGADRKLAVSEINKSLFNGVELLTLSACNTAVTTEKSNGVEVEGFGTVAQTQGARAVIATLWEVADPSTRDFMVKFYSLYNLSDKINKAEAVRQSQLSLLQEKNFAATGEQNNIRGTEIIQPGSGKQITQTPFVKDLKKPYAHPYYWAPFVLFGNWK